MGQIKGVWCGLANISQRYGVVEQLTIKCPLVNSGVAVRARRLSCRRLTLWLLLLVRRVLAVRGEPGPREGVEVVHRVVVAGTCLAGFVAADAQSVWLVLGLAAFETVWGC